MGRATEFFLRRVHPWWREIVCSWSPELRKYANELLLAGIFLSLRDIAEGLKQGNTYFRITPFFVQANSEAVLILDIEAQGRTREVSVWLDSAVGLPDPTIRISTGASGTSGNGVRVAPGGPNELGKVPADVKLFVASDVSLNGYVIERG